MLVRAIHQIYTLAVGGRLGGLESPIRYIMRRTQISLTDHDRRVLDAAVARTGRSLSALIRDAVEQVYGSERSAEEDLVVMRRAFGSWKDRELDGAAWVEQRRSGSRLA